MVAIHPSLPEIDPSIAEIDSDADVTPLPADVVVSVGTDRHPFDRLIEWIDEWRAAHPSVSVVVQHGESRKPEVAVGKDWIPHTDLRELFTRASVVVTHGGPSTIMEVRSAGHMPVVMARNPEFGEHVDDHQMRFVEHLDRNGQAAVVDTKEDLFDQIDRALADPAAFEVVPDGGLAVGVAGFGDLVDDLLKKKKGRKRR